MPALQKTYTLEVDPVKFPEACSSTELMEKGDFGQIEPECSTILSVATREKSHHLWSSKEYIMLVKLYKDHTIKEIAMLMNRSFSAVSRKVFNLELRKSAPRAQRRKHLNAEKISVKQIGVKQEPSCLIDTYTSTVEARDKANIALERAKAIETDHEKRKVAIRIDPRTIVLTSNPEKYKTNKSKL
jgi:hypothetical protein